MCVFRQNDLFTSVSDGPEATLAAPSIAVGDVVEVCIFRDIDNDAGIAGPLKPALTFPRRTIRLVCQISMIRQVDPKTSIPRLFKAAIAGPSGFKAFLDRVAIFWNDDCLALRSDAAEQSDAPPLIARGRKVSILGYLDHLICIFRHGVTAIAFPSRSIGSVCRIGVYRNDNCIAGSVSFAESGVAFPSRPVFVFVGVGRHFFGCSRHIRKNDHCNRE